MLHKVSKSCLQFSQVFQKWPKFARIYHYFPKVTQGFQKLPKISKSCPKLSKSCQSCQKLPKIAKWRKKVQKVAKGCQKFPKLAKSSQTLAPLDSTWLQLAQFGSTWLHLAPLGSTWLQLVPPWLHWVRLGQFAWGWLPINLLRRHKFTRVWDWMGWDHWTTSPLEHRSLSGANKMADLEQDLQYQERGGLLQNDLIRLKAEKRALGSDYEWKEKRGENLKVMWNMLQLEEKNSSWAVAPNRVFPLIQK